MKEHDLITLVLVSLVVIKIAKKYINNTPAFSPLIIRVLYTIIIISEQ